jgi:hypothetical protein
MGHRIKSGRTLSEARGTASHGLQTSLEIAARVRSRDTNTEQKFWKEINSLISFHNYFNRFN